LEYNTFQVFFLQYGLNITEGFGSPSDTGDYTLTITDIKWLSKNMKITVWGISPDGTFSIDGGPDESFFVIEKLHD